MMPKQAVDISFNVSKKDPKNILAKDHPKSGPFQQVPAKGHGHNNHQEIKETRTALSKL